MILLKKGQFGGPLFTLRGWPNSPEGISTIHHDVVSNSPLAPMMFSVHNLNGQLLVEIHRIHTTAFSRISNGHLNSHVIHQGLQFLFFPLQHHFQLPFIRIHGGLFLYIIQFLPCLSNEVSLPFQLLILTFLLV